MLSYRLSLGGEEKDGIRPGSELHIGIRKFKKMKIPRRNVKNNDSGRSDDRTLTGILFKNILSAAAAAAAAFSVVFVHSAVLSRSP